MKRKGIMSTEAVKMFLALKEAHLDGTTQGSLRVRKRSQSAQTPPIPQLKDVYKIQIASAAILEDQLSSAIKEGQGVSKSPSRFISYYLSRRVVHIIPSPRPPVQLPIERLDQFLPSQMANTDAIEPVEETQPRFACPFFKAYPSIWIECGECVSYSKQQLKKILIRHHFFAKHQKLNERLEPSDPRRIDPRIFNEASQWLKGLGRAQEDEVVWKFLYDKIAVAYGLNRSNPPDPYWTVQWLSTTLTELSRPFNNTQHASTHVRDANHTNDTISHLQARILAMGTRLESAEKLCRATCEDIRSLQTEQKQIIPILDNILAAQESVQSPSSLPFNGSDTQQTGSIFDNPNKNAPRGPTATAADADMSDPSNVPFHGEPPGAPHNSFEPFPPDTHLDWDNPAMMEALNRSGAPYNAFTTDHGGQPLHSHFRSHVTDPSTTHTGSSYYPFSEFSNH